MSTSISSPAIKLQNSSVHTFALVDDENQTREHWIKLLESFDNFKCVAACPNGEEALRIIPAAKPRVILMDIFMPGISGIACTAQLKIALPQTQILIFTASDDPELVFPALEAGADGYLIKQAQPAEVHNALLGVLNGELPMTSGIARRVAEYFRKRANMPHQAIHLSQREKEILVMLSKGYSNKEIASELKLSIATVHSYLKNVYEKMHVHSRTQAVAKYLSIQSS
ncbi:MAG TPA: response regulator transcription factor [Verrucomicrobiae bacterium]|jgi:DNA-binding NarL/FixJ family response regulator